MNLLGLKGNWNIVKGRLKQRLAQLAEDDQQFTEGKEEELIGRIQKRTGEIRGHITHSTSVYNAQNVTE
jgi:uncharacterized protein YjbJ (UPF0337 family)